MNKEKGDLDWLESREESTQQGWTIERMDSKGNGQEGE